MPLVDLEVVVESNVDRLSAAAVHHLYADLVDRVVDRGREALRANAASSVRGAYGTTGGLVEHVDSDGPHDAGAEITGAVGVKPVPEARLRPFASMFESDPADYPLFRDQGTGLFGPEAKPITSPRDGVMRFDGHDGEPVFRYSTRGQLGAFFMLRTFEEMARGIVPAEIEEFERDVRALG